MFEHKELDGNSYRLLAATQANLSQQILEHRDNSGGRDLTEVPRTQHGVIGNLLVERYLPAETVGAAWPHDAVAEPWWEVVSRPPHAGILADFNATAGGLYRRELAPSHNVVAFAQNGEEVVLDKGIYSVNRAADGERLSAPSLLALRAKYFAD